MQTNLSENICVTKLEETDVGGSMKCCRVSFELKLSFFLQLSEDILPDLSLLRIFQNADRRRPNSGNAELDVLNDNSSEQSTPIGSLLSLTDETSYNFNALNPLSISVPNLSTQASVGTLPQEIRDRLLWGSNRSARVVCGNVADAAPSNENDPGGSSPLSGAQSFPTLSQQEDVPEPLGLLLSTRTRALLRSMRSTSSDSGVRRPVDFGFNEKRRRSLNCCWKVFTSIVLANPVGCKV